MIIEWVLTGILWKYYVALVENWVIIEWKLQWTTARFFLLGSLTILVASIVEFQPAVTLACPLSVLCSQGYVLELAGSSLTILVASIVEFQPTVTLACPLSVSCSQGYVLELAGRSLTILVASIVEFQPTVTLAGPLSVPCSQGYVLELAGRSLTIANATVAHSGSYRCHVRWYSGEKNIGPCCSGQLHRSPDDQERNCTSLFNGTGTFQLKVEGRWLGGYRRNARRNLQVLDLLLHMAGSLASDGHNARTTILNAFITWNI